MNYILYNPFSGKGLSKETAEKMKSANPDSSLLVDMTGIKSYAELFSSLASDDVITVCGGDGTLNRFVNEAGEISSSVKLKYFPAGTGNDFFTDVSTGTLEETIDITEYVKDLPTVTVNGKDYKFINGVGYGIDGYCCEVGDELHAKGKPVNYTSIAIKGLLFNFKPRNATVIVDGVEKSYKKVWIAPTMKGRFYGGGMMPTPAQDRLCEDGSVSVLLSVISASA